MTHYIGDVPITSIQEVDKSIGQEVDELDIISEDSNILLNGSSEVEEIEITFTLVEEQHPERLDVEEQRSEAKELISKDSSDNYFNYNNFDYFLSIDDISIPETSDVKNIREGVINAKALNWPKHFPSERVGNNKLNLGEVKYILKLDGDIFTASNFSEGHLILSFNVKSISSKEVSSESKIDYSLIFGKEAVGTFGKTFGRSFGTERTVLGVNIELSLISQLDYRFDFEDVFADMKWSSVGCLQLFLNYDGGLALQIQCSGSIDYLLNLEAGMEADFGGRFGRTFGRTFGGYLESGVEGPFGRTFGKQFGGS